MSGGTVAIVIVVVVVIIAGLVASALLARRRKLQQQFGPEYDRAVAEQNSRLRAEAELTDRQRRVRKLDIRPLNEAARTQYAADWVTIQERFVDSPEEALADAHALVTTVMTERGYPTDDDEQVQADLSVEHARTVSHFRTAQEISRNSAAGTAETEDLRQALIHYRALFTDLLGVPGTLTPVSTTTVPSTAGPSTASNATNGEYSVRQPAPQTDAPAGPDTGVVHSPTSTQSDPATHYGGMP